MELELAGGVTLERASKTREATLRRAPEWWRNLANKGLRAAAAARAPVVRDDRPAGWIVGVAAPGESLPAFSPQDQQTLPEVFAPSAWESVMEQLRQGRKPIGLWVGHAGQLLATTSARTLRLEVHPLLGLMFEAQIPNGHTERMLLEDMKRTGCGCSVGFHNAAFRHEQRNGKTVRVVERAIVEHIGLVTKGSGTRALYPAARCVAVVGDNRDQLAKAWSEARTAAWSIVRLQRV
jgi:phage head maturation protease